MNKKRLLAYPIIDELEYRQNIDSEQLNKMLSSIEQSILRSIIRSTELATNINKTNLGIINSYNALFSHQKSYESYPNYNNVCFCSAFDDKTSGGRMDKTAGIVTLDWHDYNKQSKIPIHDGILSPNVKIYVDGTLRAQDDDVYNILDGDNKTFWIEETSTTSHYIEIQLPPSLTKRFNYLNIVPFPVFGMSITKIQYSDLQSAWQTIYDSDKTSSTYKPYRFYNNSGPMTFHLSPKEYNNSIKIYFNVKPGFSVMGFSKLDLGFIDYHNTATTVKIPFSNLPSSSTITPTKIDLDFYIDYESTTDLNEFFSKSGGGIYITNDGGTELSSIAPIQGPQEQTWSSININNGLWLKVVMNEVDTTTPVFRGCKLTYST